MKYVVMAMAMVLCVAAQSSYGADNRESEKDWCLLGISNKCPSTTTIDLVDKIRRLQIAIDKGSAVYSPEEIDHFNKALEEANATEDFLLRRR